MTEYIIWNQLIITCHATKWAWQQLKRAGARTDWRLTLFSSHNNTSNHGVRLPSLASKCDHRPGKDTTDTTEKSHEHHFSWHGLQTITDHGRCRHVGGPAGSVEWTRVIPETSCLHYLLPDRRDSDIVNKLRQPKIFQSLAINTVKFSKSFIPYCLKHYQ